MNKFPLYTQDATTGDVHLHCPLSLPKAGGFLWNKQMMLQVNCQGYATAKFMQPEPSSYAHGPALEAKTFMQPEHPYFAHHPGRFFYFRDNKTGEIFSAPFAPVKKPFEKYDFSVGQSALVWSVEKNGLQVELKLTLTSDDIIELWQITICNSTGRSRDVSVFPYFPFGYMSWMNQSADFYPELNAIIANSITPYQHIDDYHRNKDLKDKTYLLSDKAPDAWLANQGIFEGCEGLHSPAALKKDRLCNTPAHYETPAAVMQFNLKLDPGSNTRQRFLFGPAKDNEAVSLIKARYFDNTNGFNEAAKQYANHISSGNGCMSVQTPDRNFDQLVNNWLPRQTFYLGDANRLSTDPQTRNYLQDNMGMVYIKPDVTRTAFVKALSQQFTSGEMPDGILLNDQAELKYINQVPHSDHCIWIPICLRAYLSETADFNLLKEIIPFKDSDEVASLLDHVNLAMDWLIQNRDERGLSFIKQGDWCDPMNMVGHKGKGVSGWLSFAASYALKEWAEICTLIGASELATKFHQEASAFNLAMNTHLWDGDWYGRGITDEGVPFGISNDKEGRIFLNPQSWALLSGAANSKQIEKMLSAIENQLDTPYGAAMLAPAYTKMRDDVGRVTQKFPGSAENGAIYNHATIFYAYSLFQIGDANRAFEALRKMIPDEKDALQRGQLPTFIPNYYRGAYHQLPRTAGISSQLFNTGTVAWYYRMVIEELFGLKGCQGDLLIEPKLPESWNTAHAVRAFASATFDVTFIRRENCTKLEVILNNTTLKEPRITGIKTGKLYKITVVLPKKNQRCGGYNEQP